MDIVTNTKMRFRKEQWKQIILNREASGLSVAAWYKQNGVVQSTYFEWLHEPVGSFCQSLPEIQNGQFLWVTTVAENQGLARKIQFRIHTGITLNMKRDLCTV